MPTAVQRRSLRVGVLIGAALTLLLVGVLVLAGGGDGRSARPGDGGVGDRLPVVKLTTLDGDVASWDQFDGKPMVLNLWASWCPPCIKEMPDFEVVHQDVQDRITFVGLNSQDIAEQAKTMAAQTGVTFTLLRDARGDLLEALQGVGLPMTVFVDAEGRIVDIHNGPLTEAALRAELDRLFPAA
jgi:thiol-disulfide isomerase/thioredoxin